MDQTAKLELLHEINQYGHHHAALALAQAAPTPDRQAVDRALAAMEESARKIRASLDAI